MKVAFADSTFYIALLIPRDSNHERAKIVAQSWAARTVTTEYVLTEVANHLCGTQQGRERYGQLLSDIIADPMAVIIESSSVLWRRGSEFYTRRSDKQWSLTDCISFLVMQDRKIDDALTADHHFEQAGFRALLIH